VSTDSPSIRLSEVNVIRLSAQYRARRPNSHSLADTIIPAVDRVPRDTTDLLVIARDMQRAGAVLRSLAEPVIDTTSNFAELGLAMLGVAAELEHRRIKERTARGRADAKANGVKFGRKLSLTPRQQQETRRRIDAGKTQRSVVRSCNVSQASKSRLR
jgi:DNA invertase Pin-like site-specific DNA recombinase